LLSTALLLAHCGANWKYCDGGTAVTAVVLLLGVIWAGKRAERKKQARREEHMRALEAAGLFQQLAAENEGLRALAARQPRRQPGPEQSQGTRKKRKT
jgi:hypothetical protein